MVLRNGERFVAAPRRPLSFPLIAGANEFESIGRFARCKQARDGQRTELDRCQVALAPMQLVAPSPHGVRTTGTIAWTPSEEPAGCSGGPTLQHDRIW
jgi:hypothetical protein